jgi:hypothetical protein
MAARPEIRGARQDARFEDAAERPLRLHAVEPEDLAILSALVQDAVTEVGRAAWARRRRRFTVMLNRFRWEDAERALREGRPFERVQSLLVIDSVLRVRAQGVDPRAPETVLSVLALVFEPDEDGTGTLRVTLAGDGEVAIDVECLDVSLCDVSRPYAARATAAPVHAPD